VETKKTIDPALVVFRITLRQRTVGLGVFALREKARQVQKPRRRVRQIRRRQTREYFTSGARNGFGRHGKTQACKIYRAIGSFLFSPVRAYLFTDNTHPNAPLTHLLGSAQSAASLFVRHLAMKIVHLLIVPLLASSLLVRAGEDKTENHVNADDLYKLIRKADRVIVKKSPRRDSAILFQSANRDDIDSLEKALTIIIPRGKFCCACEGEPTIYLYSGKAELISITNHHGVSVSTPLWDTNVEVANPQNWIKWFDKRKITSPRKEYEYVIAQSQKSKSAYNRWLAAMPKALQSPWEQAVDQFGISDIAPLRKELERSIPNQTERICALLFWFGSGAGPWSGFPSYENAAEELPFGIRDQRSRSCNKTD
jgi:hypothetical protein